MTEPDPNVNIFRHLWGAAARASLGYPEEKRKEAIERLSHSTSEAGKKEYLRLSGKGKKI